MQRTRVIALLTIVTVWATGCGVDDPVDVGEAPVDDDSAVVDGGDAGISDTAIRIGTAMPFSGPSAAYGTITEASAAYFDYINEEHGGVTSADGVTRQLEYVFQDNEGDPARTVEVVRRMVERDEIFALFSLQGSGNVYAVADYTESQGVPNVFFYAATSDLGSDHYDWKFMFPPPGATEAAIAAEFIREQIGDNARVAFFTANLPFGPDLLAGFEHAIEGTGIEIVAYETHEPADPSVDSQVVNMAATEADVLMNYGLPVGSARAMARAHELDWRPLQILGHWTSSIQGVLEPAGFEAAEGVYALTYLKDPLDPRWDEDDGVREYKRILEQYAPRTNANDLLAVQGFAQAEALVAALALMEEPTREGLAHALRSMPGTEISLLLPGITLTSGPDDPFVIESMGVSRFSAGRYELVGDVITDWEGQSIIFEPAP